MGQSRFLFCCLLALSGLGLPVLAQAQEATSEDIYGNEQPAPAIVAPPDEVDAAPVRPLAKKPKTDPYSVTGIDDGVFSLKPSLEIGSVASNNASLSASDRQAGLGYYIKPSLSFATNWPVNQWTGSLTGNWLSVPSATETESLSGTAQTDFRLDIRRSIYADFDATASVTESPPEQNQVPINAITSRRDWTAATSAAITNDFGPAQATVKLGISRSEFGDVALSDGTTQSNAAMNYTEPSATLRGSLGFRDAPFKPYVELAYTPRFHDENGDARNSQGASASVGLTFNDGPIWQGDVAVIGLARQYADPSLGTLYNAGLNGSITWSPTPLWSIVGISTTQLNESEIAGVADLPTWVFGLKATYAARDNLFLHTGTSLTLADNGSGLDQTTTASVGADYMFTPHFGINGTAQSTWFNSSVSPAYDEQRLTLGVLLKP
ncbi:MAG: outer membrane beta-barrel protein [Aestuariivirga sp.]